MVYALYRVTATKETVSGIPPVHFVGRPPDHHPTAKVPAVEGNAPGPVQSGMCPVPESLLPPSPPSLQVRILKDLLEACL